MDEARRSCPENSVPTFPSAKERQQPGMVHVHVRTCSEPLDKASVALRQLSATREACRKLTSLFPNLWGGAKDQKRAARQPQAAEAPATVAISRRASDASSLESSASAARIDVPSPPLQNDNAAGQQLFAAHLAPEATCVTPPHGGRIRYSYRKRPKELRTIGGPLRDADPGRDFSLLQEDDNEISPVHAAVARLLDCLQTHSVESWESMLPHCSENPEVSTTSALFYGKCAPPISVEDYILRIQKYSHCTPAAFLYAIVYMDRLVDRYGVIFAPNMLNVHRILLTGVVVAAKFLDDRVFSNAYYARIGGVTTQELNGMEREFLKLLSYKLRVKPALVESYCKALETSTGKRVLRPDLAETGDAMESDVAM